MESTGATRAGDTLLDNGREDAQKLVRAFDVNGASLRSSALLSDGLERTSNDPQFHLMHNSD